MHCRLSPFGIRVLYSISIMMQVGQGVSLHHRSQKQHTSSSAFHQGRDYGCRAGFLKVSRAWSKTSTVLESIPELCINMFHCQDPCISFQAENWLVNSHLWDTYCSENQHPPGYLVSMIHGLTKQDSIGVPMVMDWEEHNLALRDTVVPHCSINTQN